MLQTDAGVAAARDFREAQPLPEGGEGSAVAIADAQRVGDVLPGVLDHGGGDALATVRRMNGDAADARERLVVGDVVRVAQELLQEQSALRATFAAQNGVRQCVGQRAFVEDVGDAGHVCAVAGEDEGLRGQVEEAFEVFRAGAVVRVVQEGVGFP